MLGITVVPQALYAASCSHPVPPYPHSWYPPTWSYSDSFVSLFGETQQCWSGEQFSHKGHTFGAQYPGVPLSQIRVQVWDWEELWDSGFLHGLTALLSVQWYGSQLISHGWSP